MNVQRERPSLTGIERQELEAWVEGEGEKRYRAGQILEWVYGKRAEGVGEMSNLGKGFRERLDESFALHTARVVERQGSEDATRKYLLRLHDGRHVECVLIPPSVGWGGEVSDRRTLCVSSQVGCAYDCKFCASGLAGFTRNLDAGEIVEQLLVVERESGERVSNIVFMGMGEPLANLRNVTKAIRILNAPWGVEIGARHMTVSTSGLAPQIEKMASEPISFRLAISLHGATDDVRERIMPVNRKYPIERLFEAIKVWRSKRKQKITLEYILIEGVNDGIDQAKVLGRRAKSVGAKVNLIPYNQVDGLEWRRPEESVQEQFLAVVKAGGAPATLRREKGGDIDAACGQLRLRREN
ncbi:MAG: 23S rRNA (adenine(2503)-C(2))-methyltransferase RlmN [Verrucomicrobiota bacterium]